MSKKRSLLDVFKFGKPQGPGFGISAGFYVSVLTGKAQMPSVLQVVNPKGDNGAVPGFGVPLARADKSVLERPMERGIYALASLDRKTVLKTMVLSKEEAGFDPEAYVRAAGIGAEPELVSRIRSTWQLVQFTYESHDPDVWPAVDFLLGCAGRVGLLTGGVVADPISRVYKLPHEVFSQRLSGEVFSVFDTVWPQFLAGPNGVHVYTLGMQKFGLPEFEFLGVEPGAQEAAARFLMSLATQVLKGAKFAVGDIVGSSQAAFQVAEGGLDRGLWGAVKCCEMIPTSGDLSAALRAWESGL